MPRPRIRGIPAAVHTTTVVGMSNVGDQALTAAEARRHRQRISAQSFATLYGRPTSPVADAAAEFVRGLRTGGLDSIPTPGDVLPVRPPPVVRLHNYLFVTAEEIRWDDEVLPSLRLVAQWRKEFKSMIARAEKVVADSTYPEADRRQAEEWLVTLREENYSAPARIVLVRRAVR